MSRKVSMARSSAVGLRDAGGHDFHCAPLEGRGGSVLAQPNGAVATGPELAHHSKAAICAESVTEDDRMGSAGLVFLERLAGEVAKDWKFCVVWKLILVVASGSGRILVGVGHGGGG